MAYIGPGSGISVIGSLLGLLATLLIAVGAIALFPIRKMMKRRSEESHPEKDEDVTDVEPGNPSPEPARKEGLNTE
jgi:hypothetical protein